ncbi:MAG TPA: hypothetical protein VHU15_00625 [Stellaceae bacterium]|jgi:hypothetical protein|nr:hypothetical protein [Stellaceae bacterium]
MWWRALLIACAVLALGAPAFADQTAAPIKHRTVKKSIVHHRKSVRRTIVREAIIPLPPPPIVPARVAITLPPGHWRWEPGQQIYTWVGGPALAPPRPFGAWLLGY